MLREIISMNKLKVTKYKNYIQYKTNVMGSSIRLAVDETLVKDSDVRLYKDSYYIKFVESSIE